MSEVNSADAPDPQELLALANYRMPFGKYKGWFLIDLPEPYVVWFSRKGFPPGKLGRLMQNLYEIKLNGLEDIVRAHRTGNDAKQPPVDRG